MMSSSMMKSATATASALLRHRVVTSTLPRSARCSLSSLSSRIPSALSTVDSPSASLPPPSSFYASSSSHRSHSSGTLHCAIGRLYVLDIGAGIIFTVNPDGSNRHDIVTGCHNPDGIAVDVDAGHIYWTNMGSPKFNNGSIERADLDGQNRRTIVPEGGTFTPKQLHLETKGGKLYWCDREGMCVMRSNTDGSQIETLVDSSLGDERPGLDATKWCVGITVDSDCGRIYWSQKGASHAGQGVIYRAGIELPAGESAAGRSDIEVFYAGLPEPIDLEFDGDRRVLYWTDRGDPPRGNTVNRASVDAKPEAPEIVADHLMQGIGITLDIPGDRMFMTDLAGNIHRAKLDGSEKRILRGVQGNLTGVAFAGSNEVTSPKGETSVSYDKDVQKITVVGTGTIGASWTTYYLSRGFGVVATDPGPDAESNLRKYVDSAWGLLEANGLVVEGASRDRLVFMANQGNALEEADFVQEQAPERPHTDFKARLYVDLSEATPPDTIIASSSSGIQPSIIQSMCKHPERVLIGHPFNPPHILPLVEVVGGAKTSPDAVQQAMAFYAQVGKKPILLHKEFEGHVANRLQAALYREVTYLIQQGVLSVEDADHAVSFGPGLRWGVMGPSLQWHLGGGEGGIHHFMDTLYDGLMHTASVQEMPDVNDELKKTILDGVLAEAGDRTLGQLAQSENEVMLAAMKLRDQHGFGSK